MSLFTDMQKTNQTFLFFLNYSQLFVVGIVQSRPLVLLVRLPLDRLVVGIQVGAVQTVVILNQACGEGENTDFNPSDGVSDWVRAEGSN